MTFFVDGVLISQYLYKIQKKYKVCSITMQPTIKTKIVCFFNPQSKSFIFSIDFIKLHCIHKVIILHLHVYDRKKNSCWQNRFKINSVNFFFNSNSINLTDINKLKVKVLLNLCLLYCVVLYNAILYKKFVNDSIIKDMNIILLNYKFEIYN